MLRQISQQRRGIHPEIWARWSAIVGTDLAGRAIPFNLSRRILTIKVANSSWLQELSYLKHKLLERIALEVGQDIVDDIKFRVDVSIRRSADIRKNGEL